MRKLTVPENINLNKEVLKGMGKSELLHLLLAVLPACVCVTAFWWVNSNPGSRLLALVGLLIYVMICYAVFSTPEGSQSIYSFITRWIRFMKSQKFYRYKQEKEDLFLADENEKF